MSGNEREIQSKAWEIVYSYRVQNPGKPITQSSLDAALREADRSLDTGTEQ